MHIHSERRLAFRVVDDESTKIAPPFGARKENPKSLKVSVYVGI